MKNITVSEFCRKFDACQEARDWAYKLTKNKSKEKMSVIWAELSNRPQWLFWTMGQIGVMDDRTLRLLACEFARDTPLGDGRTNWDNLTDERSRQAIVVAEKFANGEATADDLESAWYAARAAAESAWYAARAAAESAWYAARAAAESAQVQMIMRRPNPFLGNENE